jgi:hypothetical protein
MLEPEQEALLADMVEAARSVPRQEQKFFVGKGGTHVGDLERPSVVTRQAQVGLKWDAAAVYKSAARLAAAVRAARRG